MLAPQMVKEVLEMVVLMEDLAYWQQSGVNSLAALTDVLAWHACGENSAGQYCC